MAKDKEAKDKEAKPATDFTGIGDTPTTPFIPPKRLQTATGNMKSFKPDTSRFTPLPEGSQLSGVFVNAKRIMITERRPPHGEKEILIIKLRDEETDEVQTIGCGAMLEQAWDMIVDERYDGDNDKAVAGTRGHRMIINRGMDTITQSSGNTMGTYEILLEE